MKDKPDIDLGDDHFLFFTCWNPDDLPQNRKTYGIPDDQPMPRVEKWGAFITHGKCESGIQFDGEWQRKSHENYVKWCKENGQEPRPYVAWQVQSWEPLTLTPSLLCIRCKDHGFIRDGKWVKA